MVLDLKKQIPSFTDWPRPGVNFLDVGALLASPELMRQITQWFTLTAEIHGATSLVAVESRGFLFAAPASVYAQVPLILARKPGKLPGDCVSIIYDTEYSTDCLEIQRSAPVGARPLIIDDVLATGGTACAVADMLASNWNTESVAVSTLIELGFLSGRQRLVERGVHCYSHTAYSE